MCLRKSYCQIIFLFLFLNVNIRLYGQKEAWNWYLADSGGIHWENGKTPKSVNTYKLKGYEGTGAISDSAGNLLFFTNGVDLYNYKNEKLNKDFSLKGDPSSTQGELIIKHPESIVYHVFTNKYLGIHQSPMYHTSFIYQGDTAYFLKKAEQIKDLVGEGVTAIYHQNQRDIILISHSLNGDTFYYNYLTKEGLYPCTKTQKKGIFLPEVKARAFAISISTSGALLSFKSASIVSPIDAFKFNTQMLVLSDYIRLRVGDQFDPAVFSSNDSFIYFHSDFSSIGVSKITKWNGDSIVGSMENIFYDPDYYSSNMRNAPGGKILITRENRKYISIINNPNKPYPQCDFVDKAVVLIQGKGKLGNYNTNQSYFYTPSINYKYKQDCNSNIYDFTGIDTFAASSFNWQINKGSKVFTYSGMNVKHHFSDTGIWHVKYIASNGKRIDSIKKDIEIFPVYKSGFLGKDIGYCDTGLPFYLNAPMDMNCYTWQTPKGTIIGANTIKVDTAGTYLLQMCNALFCNYFDTISIYPRMQPDTPNVVRRGDSLFVANAETDVSYKWFKNNSFTGNVGIGFKLIDTGMYSVFGEIPSKCYSEKRYFYADRLHSNKPSESTIMVYPNPAQSELNLEGLPFPGKIEIIDCFGRCLITSTIENQTLTLPIMSIAPGNYWIRIVSKSQSIVTRFMKF